MLLSYIPIGDVLGNTTIRPEMSSPQTIFVSRCVHVPELSNSIEKKKSEAYGEKYPDEEFQIGDVPDISPHPFMTQIAAIHHGA
jgi:hypothetical protein